jgi:hypothetical protein
MSGRIEVLKRFLTILQRAKQNNFRSIVAGDSCWFQDSYSPETRWRFKRSEVDDWIHRKIASQKTMVTIFWGIDGFSVIEPLSDAYDLHGQY